MTEACDCDGDCYCDGDIGGRENQLISSRAFVYVRNSQQIKQSHTSLHSPPPLSPLPALSRQKLSRSLGVTLAINMRPPLLRAAARRVAHLLFAAVTTRSL
jgi:hypothetical protein